VFGFKADVSWTDLDGTNTCFAYSGYYVSANCRVKIDTLGALTGRAAWALPFDGRLVSPEDGEGIGVQLEATLSYAVTDAFSLGIGGRYWSVWTTNGTVNFGGTGAIVPMRYAAELAHLLVQGSYKFGFNP
jgi:hypothetical protein